jgi:hypothetical protein
MQLMALFPCECPVSLASLRHLAHLACRDLSESRYDFPIVGDKKWLCSLQQLLCSFRRQDNELESTGNFLKTILHCDTCHKNIPSKRFMKSADHFALTVDLQTTNWQLPDGGSLRSSLREIPASAICVRLSSRVSEMPPDRSLHGISIRKGGFHFFGQSAQRVEMSGSLKLRLAK